VTFADVCASAFRADAEVVRGHRRRFVRLMVMLAALGTLFGFTGSNEPKPLVDMSDWKPHDPSTAVAYCV
jgi:hypothetical protein